jgi:hypothetical protein
MSTFFKNSRRLTRKSQLNSQDVAHAISFASSLREVFANMRRSFEAVLSLGVNAKDFAAQYETALPELDAVLEDSYRVLMKAKNNPPAPRLDEFIAGVEALGIEIAGLRNLFAAAVAKARIPPRPIDLNQLPEASAAYRRGETRVFQKIRKNGD